MTKGLEAFQEMLKYHAFIIPDCEVVEKELKALEIIKQCLVSEFKLYEENGKYYILFYFDEIHQLTFNLKNKEEFDLLKEVLIQNGTRN